MDGTRALALMLALFIAGSSTTVLAADRFTDNGDGTLTDHELGLMWSGTDNRGDIDWRDARRWTRFTFPYTIPVLYENWRLPTTAELESLMSDSEWYKGYETDCGLHAYVAPEFELSCAWVWSSEEKSITARLFNFERGFSYLDRKAKKRGIRALPVRDIEDKE
jgi:hypothetical protein